MFRAGAAAIQGGGNSWGGGGAGGLWPPNFWPTTIFPGFSHATDRKVPSEVVLMGSLMSVIFMVMSDKTAIFSVKKSVELRPFFLNLLGDYCNPQHRVTSITTAFAPPLPPQLSNGNYPPAIRSKTPNNNETENNFGPSGKVMRSDSCISVHNTIVNSTALSSTYIRKCIQYIWTPTSIT